MQERSSRKHQYGKSSTNGTLILMFILMIVIKILMRNRIMMIMG